MLHWEKYHFQSIVSCASNSDAIYVLQTTGLPIFHAANVKRALERFTFLISNLKPGSSFGAEPNAASCHRAGHKNNYVAACIRTSAVGSGTPQSKNWFLSWRWIQINVDSCDEFRTIILTRLVSYWNSPLQNSLRSWQDQDLSWRSANNQDSIVFCLVCTRYSRLATSEGPEIQYPWSQLPVFLEGRLGLVRNCQQGTPALQAHQNVKHQSSSRLKDLYQQASVVFGSPLLFSLLLKGFISTSPDQPWFTNWFCKRIDERQVHRLWSFILVPWPGLGWRRISEH